MLFKVFNFTVDSDISLAPLYLPTTENSHTISVAYDGLLRSMQDGIGQFKYNKMTEIINPVTKQPIIKILLLQDTVVFIFLEHKIMALRYFKWVRQNRG
jgi:hypothetical protein